MRPPIFKFQSLGRDSVHSSVIVAFIPAPVGQFQSLGRDSVHSSIKGAGLGDIYVLFQSLGRDSVHSSVAVEVAVARVADVSIPRSGFCSFKLGIVRPPSARMNRFNPSVGILFIQALCFEKAATNLVRFQSLGRDSVHSSFPSGCGPPMNELFQSLGRDSVHSSAAADDGYIYVSEFQSLGRDSVHSSRMWDEARRSEIIVSIPRSGFCSFKRYAG